jgi:ubiquinone/menaquinone biosynthesis C-methylase UbiE
LGVHLEEVSSKHILTAEEWHNRFTQQAGWTRELRAHLLKSFSFSARDNILEVGCGTGAILSQSNLPGKKYGLDINISYLFLAKQNLPDAYLTESDAHFLPFATNSFNLSLCHYFLLWVNSPFTVLQEMHRVTQPGGAIIAFAEPDYGGRIDYPHELDQLGNWQKQALQRQGANTCMGRQLTSLFHKVGLKNIQTGILGGRWSDSITQGELETEWKVIRNDLTGAIDANKLDELQKLDKRAWKKGERVLFVPTFYGIGWVY